MLEVLVGTAGPAHFPNYQYVVADPETRHAVVVDPAWDSESIVRRLHRERWDLQAVLLTHGHSDHVNGVADLVARVPVPVFISADEAEYYGFDASGTVHCSDGETLTAGSIEVKVMQTPGHTVGSCCYLVGDDLFVGDTLFPEGIGFTHFEGGSASALYDSVRRLDRDVPAHARVHSGHRYRRGPGLSFADLRRLNVYFHLTSREDFVEFAERRTVAASHDRLLTATSPSLAVEGLTWCDGVAGI